MPTLEQDWVLLEPGVDVLAHLVPAEHRWIVLSDGRVTVYGVCPPDAQQRCRVEHRLACAGQELPDLWPWLTAMREENARRSEREANTWAEGRAAAAGRGGVAGRRGIGGVPTENDTPLVTLSMREAAYHLPEAPDAPAQLVAATTDALVDVLGEDIRRQVIVTLVGVPDGRTGVAGTPA